MIKEKNNTIAEAAFEIGYLTGDAAERRMEELREKWRLDRLSEMSYYIKKGEKKAERMKKRGIITGRKEEKIEIAKNMLKKQSNIEFISEVTGLTIEEINNLN